MSETVIFSFGIFVFMLTIWGTVVSGGIWLGRIADSESAPSQIGTADSGEVVNGLGGTPRRLPGE